MDPLLPLRWLVATSSTECSTHVQCGREVAEERGDVLWRVHVRQLLARFTDFVAAVQFEFACRVSGVSAG